MFTASFLLALILGTEPARADTWPGFRGDGTSRTHARNLPLSWSSTENVSWKSALPGYGQSSPVVWRDRVFVTAVEGAAKERCLVIALDVVTGKALWTKGFPASQQGKNGPTTSRAAPTPVADARGIYVFFESGDLLGFTHAGAVKWQRPLSKEIGELKNVHGLGGSLAQTDEAVIVLVEHNGPSYLLAVDKATGKDLWKTERDSRASWTTPIIAAQPAGRLVLVSSQSSLTSYDAVSGRRLWTLGGLAGNNIPSPVLAGNLVVIGAGEGRGNPDRELAARSNCCVRLTSHNGQPGYEVCWWGKKLLAHHASPLIHEGLVYMVTRAGVLNCLDLETGAERYVERLDNACWATPIASGEHIYFFGKDGVTTVLRSGPEFVKLATNRLWVDEDFVRRKEVAKKLPQNQRPARSPAASGKKGPPPLTPEQAEQYLEAVGDVVYGVAAVDDAFFIRTGTELYCIRAAGKPAKQE